MANILSFVVVVRMHTCMHAEVCSVLVTVSCVWNVDKYLVALQRLRVVDLIGQDVVGCVGFKRLVQKS